MKTCNKEGCQLAKDMNIKTTPNLEIAKVRFERYKDNLEQLGICEGACIPLIELIARMEENGRNSRDSY